MIQNFPFYKQLDFMDCGPACLRMVAKYYGKSFSLHTLRLKSYVSNSGVSMLGISDAAESIGFRTHGYRLTWEQLSHEIPFPCIIHWNRHHFVVLYDIKEIKLSFFSFLKRGDKVDKNQSRKTLRVKNSIIKIADPASGLLKYTQPEFLRGWYSTYSEGVNEGTVLVLEPTAEFYRKDDNEDKKLKLVNLLGYIRPYTKYVLHIILGMLISSIISLFFPFLTQSLVDIGISNSNISFIILVLVAQMILNLGQAASNFLRNWINLHVTSRVSISLISDFLIKLMKLPISFFDEKLVGDIMQRIEDQNRIRSFLTDSFITIVFSLITFLMFSIIIASYNIGIFEIFLLGSIGYILWILLFMKHRRTLDYKRFQQSAASQSNILQLVSGMQEIKLNGCEKQKRWQWEKRQIKLFKVGIKSLTLNQNQQLGALFINQTKDIVISFLSARSVINGEMSLGTMMAIQYIIGQLNAPIQQFIGFVQTAQDARISLERLQEIHNIEDEEKPDDGKIIDIPSDKDIELKNVVFQYEGPHSEKILNDISLLIPAKKTTALVGISGSGKTTLIKLLLGFYSPIKGEILINGVQLSKYSQTIWRKKCGVVMQEGYIFSDTITGNIGLIDEIPDKEQVDKAAKMTNIKEFVDNMPLGYNTIIGNEGHGLSTGQKQRLLIARAIYKNPDFIFLDEATNALDAKNEKIIMENLHNFFKGRTVLIVAHRLSTVRRADQIVVLDHGEIVEKGTHNDLVALKGEYYNLIKDQLELNN